MPRALKIFLALLMLLLSRRLSSVDNKNIGPVFVANGYKTKTRLRTTAEHKQHDQNHDQITHGFQSMLYSAAHSNRNDTLDFENSHLKDQIEHKKAHNLNPRNVNNIHKKGSALWLEERAKQTEIILDRFMKSNPLLRPKVNETVIVKSQLQVIDLGPVIDLRQEYKISIFLRLTWHDPRLSWSPLERPIKEHLNFGYSIRDEIWIPDIFFRNAKKEYFHHNTQPNFLARISGDGAVVVSSRISATVACKMDFANYPFDIHTCKLIFGSYQYNRHELVMDWGDENPVIVPEKDKTKPQAGFKLFDFKLVDVRISKNYISTSTGEYSTLMLCLKFERELYSYLFSSFLYPFSLVCLSHIGFWIHKECTPARLTFNSMAILTLTIFTMMERKFCPKVGYATAYDYYLSICFVFVVGSSLEFAFVNYFCIIQPNRVMAGIKRDLKAAERVKDLKENAVRGKRKDTLIDNFGDYKVSYNESFKERVRNWFKRIFYSIRKFTTHLDEDHCDRSLSDFNNHDDVIHEDFNLSETELYKVKKLRWNAEKAKRIELLKRKRIYIKSYVNMQCESKVDVYSRFLFPLMFMFFNGVYFCIYFHFQGEILEGNQDLACSLGEDDV